MRRTRTWIAVLGLLVAVATVGITMAHVLSGDAEIRISAQRLDDGRTEFAIQQRVDGEWGERILPRVRFLPASPTPGWKNSSPVTVQTEAGEDSSDQTASAEALETALSEAETAKEALRVAQARLDELEAPIHRDVGTMSFEGGQIRAQVEGLPTGIRSVLTIRADGEYGLTDIPLELVIACGNGVRTVGFDGVQLAPGDSALFPGSDGYSLNYRIDPAPAKGEALVQGEPWFADPSFSYQDSYRVYYPFPGSASIYLRLIEADTFDIAFVGANNETVEATFNLKAAWKTPIQPNLDRCDDYY